MPLQHQVLSKRETQIMDVLYRTGSATALQVLEGIPNPPSYSAIRALLAILERKGHIRHREEGPKYVYSPTRSRQKAAEAALERLVQTFFDGSTEKAVAALIEHGSKLSNEEADRLSDLIKKGRNAKK